LKPLATKKWRAFLKQSGLVFERIQDNHEIWNKPDGSLRRPIVFWHNKKEVPGFHIQTDLKTLGITAKEFRRILKQI